jgi:hypothetical protein
MFVFNTIHVTVRDIPDPGVVVAIRQGVEKTFSHLVGRWHVEVSASHDPIRWNVHIRGGFGHHVATFLAGPNDGGWPERLERRLRAFLQGVVPPLPIGPSSPPVRDEFVGLR